MGARREPACRCRVPAYRHPATSTHRHGRDSLPCHWPRRWDEAARGAGRAHDGAGVCVRSCNHVCRGGFLADTSTRIVSHTSYDVVVSAPRCTRPFRALWCMAVLATHRSCFRAVVDDVAETRTPHALPALAQRSPSGSAPTLRRCPSTLDGRRAPAGQPPPTSLPKPIYATTSFPAGQGRELCPRANRNADRTPLIPPSL